jgi:hypothetical protein
MRLINWLYEEFCKDTFIYVIDPSVQTDTGALILQQNNTWGEAFAHGKRYSWNKARKVRDKMNKRLMKYGKESEKPYSVYKIISECDRSVLQ